MHLEQYEPQGSWRSSIWMFVAGTAVGAAAALMMAPATGRDSREYVRRQSRKMADDVSAQADKLASAVKWGQEQATTAMQGAVDQAKSAYNKAKSFREGDAMGEQMSTASSAPSVSSPRPTSARPMGS
jgi:gas vesicle protein